MCLVLNFKLKVRKSFFTSETFMRSRLCDCLFVPHTFLTKLEELSILRCYYTFPRRSNLEAGLLWHFLDGGRGVEGGGCFQEPARSGYSSYSSRDDKITYSM